MTTIYAVAAILIVLIVFLAVVHLSIRRKERRAAEARRKRSPYVTGYAPYRKAAKWPMAK